MPRPKRCEWLFRAVSPGAPWMSRVNGTLNGTVNDSPLTDADASTEAVVGSIRPLPGRVSTPVTFPLMVLIHGPFLQRQRGRSEEHTSELQALMRISYAVFC